MNLQQFADACALTTLSEVERACHLAFFYLRTAQALEFTVADAAKWLTGFGFSDPNKTRLEQNLRTSSNTIRGQRGFKLSLVYLKSLDGKYPQLTEKSQDVTDEGTIIPEVDYLGAWGYIVSLAKQINRAYEDNIFDGCAVLMRRLVEILLILSYRKLAIDAAIKDASGNYVMLEAIISDAKTNATLVLSRNSKESLEVFRKLGNFSAHKIEYTCRREYIRPHIQEYRALVVELLHKSGIKT
jgi:hypothetical protein